MVVDKVLHRVANSQEPLFPLNVVASTRYLVDRNGNAFFINGEAAWGLICQLTQSEVDQYLDDRSLKGVNTILVMLIAHHIYISNSPLNAYGEGPFTTPGDFSTPNEAYFAHADWVIRRAEDRGFLVLLVPAYLGYNGSSNEGWFPDMQSAGTTVLRNYGQYVANRYSGYQNVIWVQGGDYEPVGSSNLDLVRAVADGILDIISDAEQTYHASRNSSALGFWGTGESWLTLNNIYTDQSTIVSQAQTEYNRAVVPFFLIEAIYEEEGILPGEVLLRTQAYQAIIGGGACGHVFGSKEIWRFTDSVWDTKLDSAGSLSLSPLRTIIESRNWWLLEPDISNLLLTAGVSSGTDQAVAALSSDGEFAVLYIPSIRQITVDLTQMNGPNVVAQWCDPTNSVLTTVSGSPFANTGSENLLKVGNNARNTGDWILLLDSQG